MKKNWHISGWNYPLEGEEMPELYLLRLMNCWGWGTWKDRWDYFKKDPEKLLQDFSEEMIAYFNLDNTSNFWDQVRLNEKGDLNTWAIFWYATIVKHQGLCLNPALSFVDNIGLDGSGSNCGKSNFLTNDVLNEKEIDFSCVSKSKENDLMTTKVRSFLKSERRTVKKIIQEFFIAKRKKR